MEMIMIPVEEFKELVKKAEKCDFLLEMLDEYYKQAEINIRYSLFMDFVKNEEFSIDREVCGRFLGFGV